MGRNDHTVLMKARALGLRFSNRGGRPVGLGASPTSFDPDSGRAAVLKRWSGK
jgi:hypothetical protein